MADPQSPDGAESRSPQPGAVATAQAAGQTVQVVAQKSATPEVGQAIRDQVGLLAQDVLAPCRVIVASGINFSMFLLVDHILYWLFEWMADDLARRVQAVRWLLDGFQALSICVVGAYFIISTVTGLVAQQERTAEMERRARMGHDT